MLALFTCQTVNLLCYQIFRSSSLPAGAFVPLKNEQMGDRVKGANCSSFTSRGIITFKAINVCRSFLVVIPSEESGTAFLAL